MQELQAGFRARLAAGRPVGEAFLCDQLENGAGYSRELARPEVFRRLLEEAIPTGDSIAARWTRTEAAGGVAAHGGKCDTSCNNCLRDYQNLAYHPLLDWRLALDMVRLVSSPSAVTDLCSDWLGVPNSWSAICDLASGPAASTLQRLGYGEAIAFGRLQGYAHGNPRRPILVIRHPLWQDDHPEWLTAIGEAQRSFPGRPIKAGNPFRILRRPADAV